MTSRPSSKTRGVVKLIAISVKCMLLIFGCLLLGACATRPPETTAYVSRPQYSRAMNVLLAAGLIEHPDKSPVRDVEPGRPAYFKDPGFVWSPKLNLKPSTSGSSSKLLSASSLALTASRASPPPTGIGFGPAIALDALWFLSSGRQESPDPVIVYGFKHPLVRPILIAWLYNEAELQSWYAHWVQAMLAAFKEIAPDSGFEISVVPELQLKIKKAVLDFSEGEWKEVSLRSDLGVVKISGGKCWQDHLPCFYYPDPAELHRTYLPPVSLRVPIEAAPDFLGSAKPAVLVLESVPLDVVRSYGIPRNILDSYIQIEDPEFPFFELFEKISAHLPESYFIYLPPGISFRFWPMPPMT